MSFELVLQYLLSGITSGSIYAIVAIGFNIITTRQESSTLHRVNS